MILRTLVYSLVALAAASTNAFAQTASNVTDPAHPLVRTLAAQHVKLLDAGRRGDTKAYRALRTAEFAKKLESVSSDQLKKSAAGEFDPKAYQLVRADSTGEVARTIYLRAAPDKNLWEVVMFKREDGQWKIGQTLAATGPGGQAPAAEILAQLLQQPVLQLR